MNLFRKKEKISEEIAYRIIAIWSPGGSNTAKLSLNISQEISQTVKTALVELPCNGIPMLAVESNLLDRTKHTDTAILEYEKRKASPIEYCHKINENLIILPANAYALPDHPITHKISNIETLHDFPVFFINQARKEGYSVIVLDLQGTLVDPMTFFTLQHAERIFLHVNSPSEVAWSLINKQRLIEAYSINEEVFAATSDLITLEEIKKVLKNPAFHSKDIKTIFKYLCG